MLSGSRPGTSSGGASAAPMKATDSPPTGGPSRSAHASPAATTAAATAPPTHFSQPGRVGTGGAAIGPGARPMPDRRGVVAATARRVRVTTSAASPS